MSAKKPRRIACLLVRGLGASNLETLAEACFRYSPQVALREREAIFIEIGSSYRILNEETLPLKLQALARRFGLEPRVAIAGDASTAIALARFGTSNKQKLPLEALFDYASPFTRDPWIARRTEHLISTLQALGLKTIQDFIKISTETLGSRFGEDAVETSLRVKGESEAPWHGFKPAERVIEKLDLCDTETQGSCSSLEAVLFVLRGLIDRAMARIRARALRASSVSISLELEDRSRRDWAVELPLPQGSVMGLLPILRERLDYDLQRKPLATPAVGASFQVAETVPGYGAQRDFFNKKEDEAEAWDALLGRLSLKLGKHRAFAAAPVDRYLPEKAWEGRDEARAAEELDPFPKRPARVLKNPERLLRQNDLLVHPRSSRRWRILEWHGPERINGEWWVDPFNGSPSIDPAFTGVHRDYFRVVTENGDQLWIFSAPDRAIYLHGYFD